MNKQMNNLTTGYREAARDRMRRIAAETVEIAKRGSYVYRGRRLISAKRSVIPKMIVC